MFLHLLSICFLVLKDLFQRDPKGSSNAEGKGDRGHVFSLLKRDNGLPGTAGTVGQFFLRHFVVVEAQSSNPVFYLSLQHITSFSSNQSGCRRTELSY